MCSQTLFGSFLHILIIEDFICLYEPTSCTLLITLKAVTLSVFRKMEYGYTVYPDEYFPSAQEEEEEEWDRQAYLDPMWEIQQKKVLLKICYYILFRLSQHGAIHI